MTKQVTTILIMLLSNFVLLGQDCIGFHKTPGCKIKDTMGYKLFGQSKSAVVEAGKTYQYQAVLFGGYDYKLGICTERGFKPIHLKIIDAEKQSVFYDNMDDDYTETVGFSNEITRSVIFEITIMASDMEFRDIGDTRVCLGIAIYWHRMPKLGI